MMVGAGRRGFIVEKRETLIPRRLALWLLRPQEGETGGKIGFPLNPDPGPPLQIAPIENVWERINQLLKPHGIGIIFGLIQIACAGLLTVLVVAPWRHGSQRVSPTSLS